VLFAPAYVAMRKGDYPASIKKFMRYANYYAIEGDVWHPDLAVALPYFAFAAAKTGDTIGLKAFLDGLSGTPENASVGDVGFISPNMKFQRDLALAYFAGLASDTDGALGILRQAMIGLPQGTDTNKIDAYQYAETCIWLYDETKEVRYRDLATEWAHTYQRMEPTMAWSYALEAAYGNPKDKGHLRAVALALYLDRNSYWLSKVAKADIDRARAWLPKNNPFRIEKKDKSKTNAI
jgi:hypothetical protein